MSCLSPEFRTLMPGFPENCQKEAFSLGFMRQETINRKGFSLQQITRYIPLFRNIERKHLCTESIPYPTDVFFVFLCVISTSAIYQYAARFQTRPDIRYDSPLPLLADFHILRAPLAYGNRVFAEHTLTGAGHVRQYHVEEIFQRCKVRRVAIGNHHIGMPPLGQILGKYLRAVADNLIGYQQTIVGKNAWICVDLPPGAAQRSSITTGFSPIYCFRACSTNMDEASCT